VKFESYWEQKEEKRRKKVEAEALQRQEMDALKESVKRAQEVGEGTAQKVDSMSTSMAGLAQSVQESIAENNRNMMLQFSQLLQGIGFAPGLQSPYS
jgi:ATPase subunit of ABC transporter with duplicated ATPase domains